MEMHFNLIFLKIKIWAMAFMRIAKKTFDIAEIDRYIFLNLEFGGTFLLIKSTLFIYVKYKRYLSGCISRNQYSYFFNCIHLSALACKQYALRQNILQALMQFLSTIYIMQKYIQIKYSMYCLHYKGQICQWIMLTSSCE